MIHSTAIRYLRDFVAIPSVNPMGRTDLDPSILGERRYAEHLRERLRGIGIDAELVGHADRPSVVAEVRAPAGAQDTLLLASHLDTVPVDGMTIDPFDPAIRDGRLHGRGSCDTKAGMAAFVAALARVLARGTLRRHVLLVGEADEELGSTGVRDVLARLLPAPESKHTARGRLWALATEPTGLRLATHHKGVLHAELRARGVACHASDPSRGRSAIVAAARAVLALEDLAGHLAERRDPVLGPATLSVGILSGGHAPNIVPDSARILLDRRMLPDEDERSVRGQIEETLGKHGAEDVAIVRCALKKPPLATDPDDPAVRLCRNALASAHLCGDPVAVTFGTDAGLLAHAGIPSVVLGPGSVEQAHTAEEWVEIEQVEAAARLFERLLEAQA